MEKGLFGKPLTLSRGRNRTKVSLSGYTFGDSIVAFIYNENMHVGAVSVGEYDSANNRASTSVVTRLGHKDDAIARKAAYTISRQTRLSSCVIAGVHLDGISEKEIKLLLRRADEAVSAFLGKWQQLNAGSP